MSNKVLKNLLAGVVSFATVISTTMPICAAENVITSSGEAKTAEVAVTATVSSNYKVKLPMEIELEETTNVGDYGPVFTTKKNAKIGVQGELYGKYLNIAVKDVRPGSKTFDQEGKLTLAKATYDEEKGIYEVINEDGSVSASAKLEYKKYYPALYDISEIDDATNIVAGGITDTYKYYDFNICTTSRISADGPTLYYGKMTFYISTEDI